MALKTELSLLVKGLLTGSGDFPALSQPALSYSTSWDSGVLASQADKIFADKARQLAASANEDLDLAGGGLTDPNGAALTFVRVKLILVIADAANTNNVVVGGAATNTFVGPFGAATHTHAVQPGDAYLATARGATAWPVTAGTGDLLRVANSGAGSVVNYDIVLIGASA